FCHRVQALADRVRLVAQLLEAWKLGEALQPEDPLEERRRAVADCPARARLAPGLRDEPALDEPRHGGVRRNSADARNLGSRARAEVGDDREGLEGRLR